MRRHEWFKTNGAFEAWCDDKTNQDIAANAQMNSETGQHSKGSQPFPPWISTLWSNIMSTAQTKFT